MRSSTFSPTPTYLTGELQLLCYRKDYAALGRAVKLCEHDAREPRRIEKLLCLYQAVLPRRRVEHHQRLNIRVGEARGR